MVKAEDVGTDREDQRALFMSMALHGMTPQIQEVAQDVARFVAGVDSTEDNSDILRARQRALAISIAAALVAEACVRTLVDNPTSDLFDADNES